MLPEQEAPNAGHDSLDFVFLLYLHLVILYYLLISSMSFKILFTLFSFPQQVAGWSQLPVPLLLEVKISVMQM